MERADLLKRGIIQEEEFSERIYFFKKYFTANFLTVNSFKF